MGESLPLAQLPFAIPRFTALHAARAAGITATKYLVASAMAPRGTMPWTSTGGTRPYTTVYLYMHYVQLAA